MPVAAGAAAAPSRASQGAVGVQETGNAPSFQEAIARLQQYWASVGCAVWLPHNTEASRGSAVVAFSGVVEPAIFDPRAAYQAGLPAPGLPSAATPASPQAAW